MSREVPALNSMTAEQHVQELWKQVGIQGDRINALEKENVILRQKLEHVLSTLEMRRTSLVPGVREDSSTISERFSSSSSSSFPTTVVLKPDEPLPRLRNIGTCTTIPIDLQLCNIVGNTCYYNSFLQVFACGAFHAKKLKQWPSYEQSNNNLLSSLYSLVDTCNSNNAHEMLIVQLSSVFHQYSPTLAEQQDSARVFIDLVSTVKSSVDFHSLVSFFELKNLQTNKCENCGNISTSEKYATVTPVSTDGSDLQKDMDQFLSYETPCTVCSKRARVTITYTSTPAVIFVQATMRKNPDKLMSGFKISANGETVRYQFLGASIHSGTVNSGHYVAVVRYNDNFFLCNDSSVVPTSKPSFIGTCKLLVFGRVTK